ncbi:unnamed protein product [Jaminaea pallidilutea]
MALAAKTQAGQSQQPPPSSSLPQSQSPSLHHVLSHPQSSPSSVLALAVDSANGYIFSSNSQSEAIHAFDAHTYLSVGELTGHTSSILALELAADRNWLFSASADGTVRVWSTTTLKCLYVLVLQGEDENDVSVGDVFALKWDHLSRTLFMGCQNTSIRWFNLAKLPFSKSKSTRKRGHYSADSRLPGNAPVSGQHIDSQSASNTDHPFSSSGSSSSSVASDVSGMLPATSMPIPRRPHKFFDSGYFRDAAVSGGTPGSFTGSNASSAPSSPGTTTPGLSSPALNRQTSLQTPQNPDARHLSWPPSPGLETPTPVPQERFIQLSSSCIIPNAHFGYVYALTVLEPSSHRPYSLIASGSGDEDVKLWSYDATRNSGRGQLELVTTLNAGGQGAVMALASWSDMTLFVGRQSGVVEVWDLETQALIRSLKGHSDDVLALSVGCQGDQNAPSYLFSVGADGWACRYDAGFRLCERWQAHDDGQSVLSSALLPVQGQGLHQRSSVRLVTGGSDALLKVWDLGLRDGAAFSAAAVEEHAAEHGTQPKPGMVPLDDLISALTAFVAFRSVSADPAYREESRQCAYWLKSHLSSLGATETQILSGANERNPLVLSVFEARGGPSLQRPKEQRKRVLIYGHYDVIGVPSDSDWKSSPWRVAGRDGYLYGRGVSDNKGPILAIAAAIQRLHSTRRLANTDIVLLIEGEEECGSLGFQECLERHRAAIGRIDTILLSNSYWLDERTPCLTMGMRGVVQCTVTISRHKKGTDASSSPSRAASARCDPHSNGDVRPEDAADSDDVHSGVQGGALREPMVDLIRLLGHLTGGSSGGVLIPGFYEDVSPLTDEERKGYESIVEQLRKNALEAPESCPRLKASVPTAESLMARWRYPSLSVHSISVSGSGNSTIIPAVVSARVSLRLVPNQSLPQIRSQLEEYLKDKFAASGSANQLCIDVGHEASWWLGDAQSAYTTALRDSISEAWSSKEDEEAETGNQQSCSANGPIHPMQIREGGSIPAVSILEKFLRSDDDDSTNPARSVGAVHLPMGQSSDSAHLKDERIRVLNLVKGGQIVEAFLRKVEDMALAQV